MVASLPFVAYTPCTYEVANDTGVGIIGVMSDAPAQTRAKKVSQADVPSVGLTQALRVPTAIVEQYAKEPTRPLDVAAALEMSPTSGPFRALCGAAIGYGLTEGGPNASSISLTQLGRRIVAPLTEGDDDAARRAAVLTPTVVKAFLEKYDASPLPSEKIAYNVLESLGVPASRTQASYQLIVENAELVGFLKRIKDKTYVDLGGPQTSADGVAIVDGSEPATEAQTDDVVPSELEFGLAAAPSEQPGGALDMTTRRVFITHGKSRRVVDQLKELLTFGDFDPIVSIDRESVSKPVPTKVMDDMRSCSAAIIHVQAEQRLIDQEGSEHRIVNQNVLIEIGAAMALYRDRFILLVEDGTTLPSNLQGLYEVRYEGDELGYEATMKVLKALNEFKTKRAT
jgi:predicted nucleotide-binding protein